MSNLQICQEVLKSEVLEKRFDEAPAHISYAKEYSFAIQLLSANDYLQKVAVSDKGSFLSAVSNIASIGLSLNPAAKEAYLVPRKGKICLDPSYSGLIKLATDSGSILWVQANIVYANDAFQDNGPGEKPTHTNDPFSDDRGAFIGVYCVAKTKEGDYLTTTMKASEVHDIRDASEMVKKYGLTERAGPWVTHFNEMAKKTVIRRAFKTWTRSDKIEAESRLAKAIDISNQNEDVVIPATAPQVSSYSESQKEYYDELITTDNALGMYVFQQTNDTGTNSNLYNSFEKGTVTRYKRIVDDLYSKGASMFEDYLNRFREAQASGDDDGILELESELEPTEIELIRERL